jgi:hypothetical protein
VLNLLNNRQFTLQREVHLSIAKAGEDRLLFEVSDTASASAGRSRRASRGGHPNEVGAAAGGRAGLAISQHLIADGGSRAGRAPWQCRPAIFRCAEGRPTAPPADLRRCRSTRAG